MGFSCLGKMTAFPAIVPISYYLKYFSISHMGFLPLEMLPYVLLVQVNILKKTYHRHLVSLVGITLQPLQLLLELAPLGALNSYISQKKGNPRLHRMLMFNIGAQVCSTTAAGVTGWLYVPFTTFYVWNLNASILEDPEGSVFGPLVKEGLFLRPCIEIIKVQCKAVQGSHFGMKNKLEHCLIASKLQEHD